jgi:hypothetical protein
MDAGMDDTISMSWTCPDQCKAKITTCWTYDQTLGLYEQLHSSFCLVLLSLNRYSNIIWDKYV